MGAPLERRKETDVLEGVRSGFADFLAHGELMMEMGDQRVVSLIHWKDLDFVLLGYRVESDMNSWQEKITLSVVLLRYNIKSFIKNYFYHMLFNRK